MIGLRTRRQILPAHEKPILGSSIVKDRFRIRLKHPFDDELWNWLCDQGWRTMPVANNRRKYTIVPEKDFVRLMKATPSTRLEIQTRITEGRSARRD